MATPSFGEKLKQERQRRNTSIEEIAEKTRIALRFLQALERDEFDKLPGRAFGKFYIRAYAEVLKFDPEPLIVEYDREQAAADGVPTETAPPEPAKLRRVEAEIARWREARRAGQQTSTEVMEERESVEVTTDGSSTDGEEECPVGRPVEAEILDQPAPLPVFDREEEAGGARYDEAAALASILGAHDATPSTWQRWRNLLAVGSCVGLVIVFAWILMSFSGSNDSAVETESSTAGEPIPSSSSAETGQTGNDAIEVDESEPELPARPTTRSPDDSPVPAPAPPAASAPDSAGGSAGITVSEFGVGRRIVNRRLEGRGRSFEEGSVVWFQTRVVGGTPGESIRHVWLRDGRAVQSVDLELGGTHWRTHSRKTLWGTGEWSVEARDRRGSVLARASFVCVPARP